MSERLKVALCVWYSPIFCFDNNCDQDFEREYEEGRDCLFALLDYAVILPRKLITSHSSCFNDTKMVVVAISTTLNRFANRCWNFKATFEMFPHRELGIGLSQSTPIDLAWEQDSIAKLGTMVAPVCSNFRHTIHVQQSFDTNILFSDDRRWVGRSAMKIISLYSVAPFLLLSSLVVNWINRRAIFHSFRIRCQGCRETSGRRRISR